MYCKNRGNEINEHAVVCIHCGCAVEQQQPRQTEPAKTNVLAIVGFVMAFFMPIAGLICSIIGYKKADKDYNGNCKGLALAGTIISAISIAIVAAVILWLIITWITVLTAIGSTAPYYCLLIP